MPSLIKFFRVSQLQVLIYAQYCHILYYFKRSGKFVFLIAAGCHHAHIYMTCLPTLLWNRKRVSNGVILELIRYRKKHLDILSLSLYGSRFIYPLGILGGAYFSITERGWALFLDPLCVDDCRSVGWLVRKRERKYTDPFFFGRTQSPPDIWPALYAKVSAPSSWPAYRKVHFPYVHIHVLTYHCTAPRFFIILSPRIGKRHFAWTAKIGGNVTISLHAHFRKKFILLSGSELYLRIQSRRPRSPLKI